MKATITAVIISIVLIGGALIFTRNGGTGNQASTSNIVGNNVSVVDGKQIIEIRAKGGYQPRSSIAKAGIPTIIRFNTNGTFDCSSYIRIPSLNISKALPRTGITDIDIGSQKFGLFNGSCGMGMYSFEVSFE